MRKESAEVVAQAARRRLALLGRELAHAGFEAEPPADGDPSVEPAVIGDPGRHARNRATSARARGAAWLEDRLPPFLQGRVSLGSGQVAVLAVIVAAALAVTAWVTVRSAPAAVPAPAARTSPVPTRPSAVPAPGAPPASAAPSGAVVVDVAGKVRRPGVATLPAGSRVIDAIRRAGGARAGVDLTSLNLARVLVDGEQVLVGVATAPGVAASAASRPGSSSGDGALVNLNSATLDQLDGLPGVGPVTAQKILDWRSAHGAFSSIDELLEVDGIGEKTLADMAPRLTL